MRVLVDSSAWIDFLNGFPSEVTQGVFTLLGSQAHLCTCGLVVTEVLQGLRRSRRFSDVEALFKDLPFVEPAGIETYLRAAEVYRRLREMGHTVRSTIDCLIAVVAEEQGCSILARDRDLERIVGSGLVGTTLMTRGEVHEGP